MIVKRCEVCSAPFRTHQYAVKAGQGRFCSVKCAWVLRKRADRAERFWAKVDKTDGCWRWTASVDHRGYGQFALKKGVFRKAHRLVWEWLRGPIPEGMHVLHTCDVRCCVNPQHLFLGTNADNHADKIGKGRQAKGQDFPQTKLTAEQATAIRRRYAAGGITQPALAAEYGVARSTTEDVLHRRTWAYVD